VASRPRRRTAPRRWRWWPERCGGCGERSVARGEARALERSTSGGPRLAFAAGVWANAFTKLSPEFVEAAGNVTYVAMLLRCSTLCPFKELRAEHIDLSLEIF
jgi:hypothetical protein